MCRRTLLALCAAAAIMLMLLVSVIALVLAMVWFQFLCFFCFNVIVFGIVLHLLVLH